MASLIETLIETLDGENSEYQKLLELSNGKSEAIVRGDLDKLMFITEKEQEIVIRINSLENTRGNTMAQIAKILNTDVRELKLDVLIGLLNKTPKEQKELARVHDALHLTLHEMKLVNERNAELLKTAKEMVDFNLNLIQASKKAPETANYGRSAYSVGTLLGGTAGGFDAKQ